MHRSSKERKEAFIFCSVLQQADLVQLKQEPVDTINGDIPKDPLAIEETNSVKSKTVKVENEVESEKVLPQLNLNMKTDELEINYLHTVKTEEEVEFYPDHMSL
ncbi:uncharacterized protein LOC142332431 [Lycorma delicatula]|uniref:uncharacterized protein LOC142332431 n=1 Tax=Lycorma delicatula TaxID=130591 RepID=UPI003F516B0E